MAFQKTRWRPYKYVLQIGQILASSIGDWGTEAGQRESTRKSKYLKLRRWSALKRYFLKELLELSHLSSAILKTDSYPDKVYFAWLLQNISQVRCFYQIPFSRLWDVWGRGTKEVEKLKSRMWWMSSKNPHVIDLSGLNSHIRPGFRNKTKMQALRWESEHNHPWWRSCICLERKKKSAFFSLFLFFPL